MSLRARFRVAHPGFTLDVDLQLPARGVTALFGASGSGKTTLLRCMAGLDIPPDGFLQVGNDTWQDGAYALPAHRRAVGMVFQDAALFPHLSVRDNLLFGMKRVPAAERRVSLDEAVELLGIGHLLARGPEHLSGGEKQRVAIARALAVSPRLLLLDEPLAALDVKRKREILPYLERLHDALAIPVVYVTHAMEEVARLADHLVVLEQGRVTASGALADVLARTDLPLQGDDDAGVVIEARIEERDTRWHLARATFAGGALWVRDSGRDTGQRVRLRILARDVSLALAPQADSSILNVLPGMVDEVVAGDHPAVTLVRVSAGGVPLLARVTAKSADALGLAPGREVWVQVKSAAVLE